MRRTFVILTVLGCLAALCPSAHAAPFQPLFQVFRVEGDCHVLPPDAQTFVPPEAGRAYPFGTRVVTGPGGSLTVVLSKDNECAVAENTSLTVAEDADAPAQKILRIRSGKVSMSLEDNYEQINMLRVVTRCSTVICKTGGQSAVDVSMEEDLKVVLVSCDKGELSARGPGFEIPVIDKNDWVSISCSHDRGFVRIKNIKGDFGVTVKDSQAAPRLVATEEGSVIKILRKTADTAGRDIVTVLEVSPDGSVKQADTYTEPIEEEEEILPEDEAMPEAAAPSPEARVPTARDDWPEIPPVATTTTTTTTTTVPPADAAAARAAKGIRPVVPVTPVTPTSRPATTEREERFPSIAVSPPQLNFGSVKIGECKTLHFTVLNDGDGWMDVSTAVPGPHFAIGGVPRLFQGRSSSVAVHFCPVDAGNFTATVDFTGSGRYGSASASATVTGRGYGDVTPTGRR